jgi:zinc protease
MKNSHNIIEIERRQGMPHRAGIGALLLSVMLAATPAVAQQPDRSGPPDLGPPPRLHLPAIQQLELSNGLEVLLMEKHGVPLVQLNALVRVGSASDPLDKRGLASLTADMLDEGAGTRDALELADAIEFLGARIRTRAGMHTTTVSLHSPLSKFDAALPLLADIVLRPTFPTDELERKRKSLLTSLLQAHDEPNAIASVEFAVALYGKDHPYGASGLGDEASIRSFSVADLRDFHRSYFVPNNAALIVVGDVTADEIMPKLEAAFGSWVQGQVPQVSWPEAPQVQRREVILVDKPGAPQSVIRIGCIGADRYSDDYYDLQVMNTILGGSFTSRLNQNLREDKGYTYGAYSYFAFNVLPGPFMAGASVQTEVTDSALAEFFKEMNGILQPVPQDEITGAENYEAFSLPAQFESVSGIAGNLDELVAFGLPLDYFNHYVDEILAVTQRDVRRVAREYVNPERVKVIVVGDRATIEDGIRALNLGPVTVLSIDDVLGPKPMVDQ